MRPLSIVDVHAIFREGERVLMQLRRNTGFADGCLHLPAGHIEDGEDAVDAARREMVEELGIDLERESLRHALTLHHFDNGSRVSFFFEVAAWRGEFRIAEPTKCEALLWVDISRPERELVPYAVFALEQISAGKHFASTGW